MSDARSCSNHCHTFDDYNGGQWMHEGGDRKWHGECRSYCWRSRQELMVVDGQPHIVDMLKLPTRTSTPEQVAEALAAVLEAAGVPAVGTMVATQQDGRGQVETYEFFGDMVMCRIVLPDDPDCACILLDLTEARALRGVEEGDQ